MYIMYIEKCISPCIICRLVVQKTGIKKKSKTPIPCFSWGTNLPRVLQRESFQGSGFESHILGLGTCEQVQPGTSPWGYWILSALEAMAQEIDDRMRILSITFRLVFQQSVEKSPDAFSLNHGMGLLAQSVCNPWRVCVHEGPGGSAHLDNSILGRVSGSCNLGLDTQIYIYIFGVRAR